MDTVIKRQVIVMWYTPEEKLPPEGQIVVATVSGRKPNVTYDHAFALAEWYNDGMGWNLTEAELDEFTVHAWCDLEPYGGGLLYTAPETDDAANHGAV